MLDVHRCFLGLEESAALAAMVVRSEKIDDERPESGSGFSQ